LFEHSQLSTLLDPFSAYAANGQDYYEIAKDKYRQHIVQYKMQRKLDESLMYLINHSGPTADP